MADTLTNNPPAAIDLLKERADRYVADAKTFATITDENEAQATDCFNLGTSLANEIEATRETEKKPHLEAGRQVDATFKPVHAKVDSERVALRARLEAHIRERKRKAEEAARLAAQKLREAEEAARLAAEEDEDDPFLAATAAPAPDTAALTAQAKIAEGQAKAAARVESASGGRAFGLRAAPKTAEITDYKALAAYLIDAGHSELKETLQRLANQNARAKGAIAWPGTKIVGGE